MRTSTKILLGSLTTSALGIAMVVVLLPARRNQALDHSALQIVAHESGGTRTHVVLDDPAERLVATGSRVLELPRASFEPVVGECFLDAAKDSANLGHVRLVTLDPVDRRELELRMTRLLESQETVRLQADLKRARVEIERR